MKKTKIIATLGPTSASRSKIRRMIAAGMDVARINMSHENQTSSLTQTVQWVRDEAHQAGKSAAILFDLSGPKVRVGQLKSKSSITILKGKQYSLGRDGCDIPLNMKIAFSRQAQHGKVKVDDGSIAFDIQEVQTEILILTAENSGEILPGKGINFPGVELDLPSVTEKDLADLKIAVDLKADWLAMSFVRSAGDLDFVRNGLKKHEARIPVIAKIEKPEAIDNLEEIINASDGILAARGDLGVEMPIKELPILQKKIVNQCLLNRKPVIIATQMLESMQHNPNPTRAEVNDVANAIYDGADAVMLSGETAVGDYPVESVQIMADIANSVEKDLDLQNFNRYIRKESIQVQGKRESICHAALTTSNDLNIESIVVMTESGLTAQKMAQYRPAANIYALCPNLEVCRRLSLIWGIMPINVEQFQTTDEMLAASARILKSKGFLKKGDSFLMTAGIPVGATGSTNMLKIHQVD